MQTSKNIQNTEDQRNQCRQSSRSDSAMCNNKHDDNVRAGEHDTRQDETQFGKIQANSTVAEATEKRAENLRAKINDGICNAGEKVNEYAEQAENKVENLATKAKTKMSELSDKIHEKIDDWTDKNNCERAEKKYEEAEKKMDKAEKKIDKAQEKFAQGYTHDGIRKMEKAEKKIEKAEEKIQEAQEKLNEHRTEKGHSLDTKDNMH
ncbi:MAG: hypothetical protein NC410_04680 [Oscillibacter sp.]|nr:hypothetical protein [Oscillibacter sp.]